MKRIFTILLLLWIETLVVNAQKTEWIKGKWVYADIADKEKLDTLTLQQSKIMFPNMVMEFGADGKFFYNPLADNPYSNYTGTWLMNKEQTKVTVNISLPSKPENKKTIDWEIKNLTAKALHLNMGKAVIIFCHPVTPEMARAKQIQELISKKKPKYNEGLANIELNGKWGYIDTSGKEIIPFNYDYADPFNGGIAMVRNGKYPNYKHGFIDKKGKIVIPVIYDNVGKLSEGFISVCINNKWGYLDKTGKEFVPLIYGGTWDFREGLAMVRNGPYLVGKCGFIDKTGKEVIPLIYEKGDEGFKEGLALVVLDGKYGFIDKTGKAVVPAKYKFASSFNEGMACVNFEGKWGFIDKTGAEKIPPIYENAGTSFSQGLVIVTKDGKDGYIDKTGKVIIPFKYDRARDFSEGLAAVMLNGKWGFIDKTGNVVLPFIYDSASGFSEGKASVKLNNEYVLIDKKGKVFK